jgi:flagellar P-ring protein precursor FlgI
MKKFFIFAFIIILSITMFSVRLKDISNFRGARDNQLFGIGLVTGLDGTGDGGEVTSEMLDNMINNLGIDLTQQIKSDNTAIVMVYADIPPFYKEGMRLDINVAAIGDSNSLENGVLIQTPLYGADNKVYAVAQGNILTGGVNVNDSSNLQDKYQVVGSIPDGAIIEREIPSNIIDEDTITVNLKTPDFTTASRVSMAINSALSRDISKAQDAASIKVEIPAMFNDDIISFLAMLEEIEVRPDQTSKIIINQRTGTVVLGGNIEIEDFTLSYGNFVISVEGGKIGDKSASVQNLIGALKAAGALPQDIISIIQAIESHIYAEIVVM